jgi:hypothetical protein
VQGVVDGLAVRNRIADELFAIGGGEEVGDVEEPFVPEHLLAAFIERDIDE